MAIITLTTDFGEGSPYAAAMKGAILAVAPDAAIVDLSHAVPPQDIRQGAMLLEQACPFFPPGTIHLAVIDPGVGTDRAAVAAGIAGQRYVAPDNGLLSLVARGGEPEWLVRLENPRFWRPCVSPTFHGRDLLGPVAAHLSRGVDPCQLGPPHAGLVALAWPEVRSAPQRLEGVVLACDAFGNALTNIAEEHLAGVPRDRARIACRGRTIAGMVRTYGERPAGTLVAMLGSSGRLELAVVGGSAQRVLQCSDGDPVVVCW